MAETQEIKSIKVNPDDFYIIQAAVTTLGCTEMQAVAWLMEIGVLKIISYPTGEPKIDEILKDEKWQKLIDTLKASYTL